MTKPLNFVHCHICPLKEICDYAVPYTSYQFQHARETNNFTSLRLATNNCPLKKLIEDG